MSYGNYSEWKKLQLLKRRRIVGECWEWTGATNGVYGVTTLRPMRTNGYIHRIAAALWMEFDITSPLYVLHKCDNPLCFNPAHLFFGTQRDNIHDCITKGRFRAGAPNRGKTHCLRGHEYTPENTYSREYGRRQCKQCIKMRSAIEYSKKRRLKCA